MTKSFQFLTVFVLFVLIASCKEDVMPKPSAFLRLTYPEAKYSTVNKDIPFSFEQNNFAKHLGVRQMPGEQNYGVNIEYPNLKGTIYLTYKSIGGDKARLMKFIQDAQNFTQKHTIKADEISEQVYLNDKRKVYGMFYEVGGNAASQSQFYVTDSIQHFLTGSLYFYTKPNYDSILPAAKYLEKDIRHIMETVNWK